MLFLASFHSNDATLSQLYVCITLLESLVKSLTIVLPFYPVQQLSPPPPSCALQLGARAWHAVPVVGELHAGEPTVAASV